MVARSRTAWIAEVRVRKFEKGSPTKEARVMEGTVRNTATRTMIARMRSRRPLQLRIGFREKATRDCNGEVNSTVLEKECTERDREMEDCTQKDELKGLARRDEKVGKKEASKRSR